MMCQQQAVVPFDFSFVFCLSFVFILALPTTFEDGCVIVDDFQGGK